MKKILLMLWVVLFFPWGLDARVHAQSMFSGSGIDTEIKKMNLMLTYIADRDLMVGIPLYCNASNRCAIDVKYYKQVEKFGEKVRGDLEKTVRCNYENGFLKSIPTEKHVYIFKFDEYGRLWKISKYYSNGNLDAELTFSYRSYGVIYVDESGCWQSETNHWSSGYKNSGGKIEKKGNRNDVYYDYDLSCSEDKGRQYCHRFRFKDYYYLEDDGMYRNNRDLTFEEKLMGHSKGKWSHYRKSFQYDSYTYIFQPENTIIEYEIQ